ncbi:beta-mannosidase [Thermicanus aegyptius]|uniref:beta-mannosidase n=1 Tax=Thermicanus aegyptius TaxID=94009 RepID=UPI000586E413|nr:glycoside hydrolase family 2 protein [Thermicanus aegyptius]
MKIDQNWRIRDFSVGEARDLEVALPDFPDTTWIRAKVPGDIHSILKMNGVIEDPFYGHNDQKCRWIEERVWWYRTSFQWEEELSQGEWMELLFTGLDLYATIYLNGVELGRTDNMFRSYSFEVTRELRKGRNWLAVKFDPLSLHVKEKTKEYWSGFSKERIWTRKTQSQFGWDWGPRLINIGIIGEVHLKKRSYAYMDSPYVRTLSLTEEEASLSIDLEVMGRGGRPATEEEINGMEWEVCLSDGERLLSRRYPVVKGKSSLLFQVPHPKRWWTHDLGEPFLYQLAISLYRQGEKIDRYEQPFGIRTLYVEEQSEGGESRFTFVLNGVPLFAKGANWVPIDSFPASVPDTRYRALLRLVKEGNMNMLRVWGGGMYEKDLFYEECDRLGILVWQDFMFACALYPDYNREFMETVKEEIRENVKRLRNRASLALWCGNNENDWLYEALKSNGEITTPFYGEKIYHELIPALLAELDPSRLYWPSSPYGGNDHNSREEGDTHNWQVWHGNVEPRRFGELQRVNYSVEGVSFKNYAKDSSRFVSEFGMHASANRFTLKQYVPPSRLYWGSEEMAYRNKDLHHEKGILLMEGYTGVPKDLEQYIRFSMLTQAEGLKYGVEHYRRNRPVTSGALIWQLNDAWPGTSWSLIDYSFLPKASYYYARKFFAPVLLSIEHRPGQEVRLWVVNDRREDYEDHLEFLLYDFHGRWERRGEWDVTVPPLSAVRVASLPEAEVLRGFSPDKSVMVLRSREGRAGENRGYFRDQKDLELPPAHLEVVVDERRNEITISTDFLARMVMVELDGPHIVMEDNFFDLLPGEVKKVKVEGRDCPIPWKTLSVTAMNGRGERKMYQEGATGEARREKETGEKMRRSNEEKSLERKQ